MALRINARRGAFANVMRREPPEPEKLLWRHLSNSHLNGLKFRRQTVIGTYIFDFCCPRIGLIVEIDGDTHVEEDRDRLRSQDLQEMGYFVIRFTNVDVMRNMDGVLARIVQIAATLPERRYTPTPTPPLEGRG